MRNNEKIIKNGMMEWRDENDGIKDDRRVVRNQVIMKSGNDERFFEKKYNISKVEKEIGFKLSRRGL